jgi:hypothetical protein
MSGGVIVWLDEIKITSPSLRSVEVSSEYYCFEAVRTLTFQENEWLLASLTLNSTILVVLVCVRMTKSGRSCALLPAKLKAEFEDAVTNPSGYNSASGTMTTIANNTYFPSRALSFSSVVG